LRFRNNEPESQFVAFEIAEQETVGGILKVVTNRAA